MWLVSVFLERAYNVFENVDNGRVNTRNLMEYSYVASAPNKKRAVKPSHADY